jgi:hypothetical protein
MHKTTSIAGVDSGSGKASDLDLVSVEIVRVSCHLVQRPERPLERHF